LALRELKRLFSRRSTRKLLESWNVSEDIDISFLEEQSTVRLVEHWHIDGHEAVVSGDRHTMSKKHTHLAISTETKDKC
jgi:hypothetical protein